MNSAAQVPGNGQHHGQHHGHHQEHAGHGAHTGHTGQGGPGAHGGHDAHAGHGDVAPGGLHASHGGHTLDLKTPRLPAGERVALRFGVVVDATGGRLTSYEQQHGKELHLIVASRDLTVYRHLHPVREADGIWSASLEVPKAGEYRIFADFKPDGGEALTLGADLVAEGAAEPAELPPAGAVAEVDGYEVRLDGKLSPGQAGELTLTVGRDGTPVTDLEPYLGAYGHLVALRSGDLAYLHVHPSGEPGDGRTLPGPEISFLATAPSAGAYRLFLDFQHEGTVRTAAFTVQAG
ncbi:hypothetical protein ACIQNG_28725 [Streptomyces sp. NPDC091377]|uniref:hypothetical protein n=1 Tax=Streptomyces sp. NPDC091377 TaxID=3365995 RepID=UPI0037FA7E2F